MLISVLGPPIAITNQEHALTDLPTGQCDKDNSLIEVLSSYTTLVCVKLTKSDQHNVGIYLNRNCLRKEIIGGG